MKPKFSIFGEDFKALDFRVLCESNVINSAIKNIESEGIFHFGIATELVLLKRGSLGIKWLAAAMRAKSDHEVDALLRRERRLKECA